MKYLLLLSLLSAALLPAQNTTCSLSGTVKDSAGAIIAGAKIRLLGEGNTFVRTSGSNREGYFNYPDLTSATFTLSIEAPGFKTYHQTGIIIGSSESRSVSEIRLQVGAVFEAITVTAEAVSVNLSTGERSGTLTGEQLDSIALRGRDIFDAISLMAGVVDTSDGRDASGPTSIGNIYIMGGDHTYLEIEGLAHQQTQMLELYRPVWFDYHAESFRRAGKE